MLIIQDLSENRTLGGQAAAANGAELKSLEAWTLPVSGYLVIFGSSSHYRAPVHLWAMASVCAPRACLRTQAAAGGPATRRVITMIIAQ